MLRAAHIGALFGLSAMLTLTSACARSTDTSAVNERAAAADTACPHLHGRAAKRILAYADSLRSRADISPDKFGTAIGVSLVPDEKGQHQAHRQGPGNDERLQPWGVLSVG
jgi:hypothetical protein